MPISHPCLPALLLPVSSASHLCFPAEQSVDLRYTLPVQLQMLSPEETVVEIHYKTAPQARQLKIHLVPWQQLGSAWIKLLGLSLAFLILTVILGIAVSITHLQAIAIFTGIIFFVFLICSALGILSAILALPLRMIENSINAMPMKKVGALRESLSAVLGNCTSSAICPELLDFLGWLQSAPPEHTRLLRITLTRLLPRVGEDELQKMLTEERRQTLRQLLTRSDTPHDLIVAALLALGSVKDQKTLPLAYALLRKSPDVKDGVEAFLDSMRVAA
jgi:hypothetical protein